jgi:ectoine hydroxylase-related dioxygenase (phytanoyl-CoA dioxygenase family)
MTEINQTDVADIDARKITPVGTLQLCNDILDDREALLAFHEREGYLLFRGLLDPASLAEARDAMLAVMVRQGLIEPGATEPVWTGKAFAGGMEESPEFSGISARLLSNPANRDVMSKILGEPACPVPIVQYRTYPPGGSVTNVHQDGYFSPGVEGFKPVWIPLCDCPREAGGLMLAIRQTGRGFFHDPARGPMSPIPEGVIPAESWATLDYKAGDVLIIHPQTPHASRPNVSKLCRVTLDTRVQSATNPAIIMGEVRAVTEDSITLALPEGSELKLRVDESTFIRVLHPGQRLPLSALVESTTIGVNLVASIEGDRAVMLRKASAN